MQRTARLILWRARPPFRKVVRVQRITLGGFLELLRTLAPKVAEAVLSMGDRFTFEEMLRTKTDAASVSAFADLVTVEQPAGFMLDWLRPDGQVSARNAAALLAASRAAEGDGQWTRYLNQLQNPAPASQPEGKKKTRGGGLSADAQDVAKVFGVAPWHVEALTLHDFLNLCETLNLRMAEAEEESESNDPTLNPNAEPTPLPKRSIH